MADGSAANAPSGWLAINDNDCVVGGMIAADSGASRPQSKPQKLNASRSDNGSIDRMFILIDEQDIPNLSGMSRHRVIDCSMSLL